MNTVLLVEDDDDMRVMLREHMVRAFGCRVLEADGAWAALRLFDAEAPDLIVSDLHMPMGSGIDFLLALRDRSSTVPVIIFSFCLPEVRENLRREGVTFIEKPDVLGLMRTLRKLLSEINAGR